MKSLKVLSLFDGISCGRIALERAGIPVDTYYASEICDYAIKISQKNYPDIIEIGDVRDIDVNDYKDTDIIIGGSPCQSFSTAGKRLAFEDPRGAAMLHFVDLINDLRPQAFILENVKLKL